MIRSKRSCVSPCSELQQGDFFILYSIHYLDKCFFQEYSK